MSIEIKHEPDDRYGAFRAYDEQGAIGSMVYVRAGEHVVMIQHTGLEDRAKGQGVGLQLFQFMVAWARETQTKIMVQCPFARHEFHKYPETRDVLR